MTSWLLNLRPAVEALSFIEIRTMLQEHSPMMYAGTPKVLRGSKETVLGIWIQLFSILWCCSQSLVIYSKDDSESNKIGDTYPIILEYVGTTNHAAASYCGVNWEGRQPSRLDAPMLSISCSCHVLTTPYEHIRIADKGKTCSPRYDNFNIWVHRRNFQLLQQVIVQLPLNNMISGLHEPVILIL